jgi:hypothetical protein
MASRPFPELLEELKDRKVVLTGAAYAATAFVVLEATDIAFPALGLPPSAMRVVVVAALAGFPVALVLSWLFEVRRERPDAEDPTEEAVVRRWMRPVARTLLVVVLVLAAGCGLAWAVAPASPAELAPEEWAILADLENHNDDSIFDHTLSRALRAGLNQSSPVRLVSPERVRRTLGLMERPADAALVEQTAREVAERVGVAAVIVPAERPAAPGFLLSTRVMDPVSGETLVQRRARAPEQDDVLEALDGLVRQLRSDLGESLLAMVRERMPLHRATTGSLEALRAWTEAGRLSSVGEDEEAVILHHVRRSDGRYLASNQIAASVDALFEMAMPGKSEDPRWRHLTGRGRWPIKPFTIALVEGQYELASGGTLSKDALVLLHVEQNPGCSLRDLRASVPGAPTAIRQAVDELLNRGAIINQGDRTRMELHPSGDLGAAA